MKYRQHGEQLMFEESIPSTLLLGILDFYVKELTDSTDYLYLMQSMK